jgi:Response regulators consisting of a CheY-like receiver domain and a winged-helix DNA-binding domain
MGKKLLIVEDDAFLCDGLLELLGRESYEACCVPTACEATEKLNNNAFDLVILDVMLPDGDGFALCARWRQQGLSVPILFLTACDDEVQIVRGLDAGGDDYITKPFRLQELLSRIRALLRRNPSAPYSHDGLVIDVAKMSVTQSGVPVFVTPTEFQLLSALIRNPGRILTRKILLQTIWDDAGVFIDDNTLSVHISRLREKIGSGRIKTVRGVGYSWEERP